MSTCALKPFGHTVTYQSFHWDQNGFQPSGTCGGVPCEREAGTLVLNPPRMVEKSVISFSGLLSSGDFVLPLVALPGGADMLLGEYLC